jgi:hypothetical protein
MLPTQQIYFIFNLFGNSYKILVGKTEGKKKKEHQEDMKVDAKIILKSILGKQEGMTKDRDQW